MTRSAPLVVEATPYEYEFSPEHAALLVIDMQRDFVEPGGVRRGPRKRRRTDAGHH